MQGRLFVLDQGLLALFIIKACTGKKKKGKKRKRRRRQAILLREA